MKDTDKLLKELNDIHDTTICDIATSYVTFITHYRELLSKRRKDLNADRALLNELERTSKKGLIDFIKDADTISKLRSKIRFHKNCISNLDVTFQRCKAEAWNWLSRKDPKARRGLV